MPAPARRLRAIAIAVALVVLAGAGWRLMRALSAELPGAAQDPVRLAAVDVQPARRAAAAAASHGGTEASAVPVAGVAASAPGKPVHGQDCGLEEAPQFSRPRSEDEAPVQTRAASTRYMNAQARLDAALRSSADPLDRAVADLVNAGNMRSESGRDEAVVQQAVGTTDGRLYALGYDLCQSMRATAPSCARISAARWAQIEPDNGLAWLQLLANARAEGNSAGVREAMAGAASAARFDTYFYANLGRLARSVPDDGTDLAATSDMLFTAVGVMAAVPFQSLHDVVATCSNHAGGDVDLERQCRAISDTMLANSDNLLMFGFSGSLLARTTGDESRRQRVHAEQIALLAAAPAWDGGPTCANIRETTSYLRRAAQVGEVQALRERALAASAARTAAAADSPR